MRHKKLMLSAIFLLGLGLGLTGLQAQEAILASGGDASGSGGSVCYSVGQVAYATNMGTYGFSVAEGVQQPYEISIPTGIEQAIGIQLECLVYPNPTTNILTLKVENYDTQNLSYLLYDMNGNLLENKKLTGSKSTIAMEALVPATYFLKITDNQKEIKAFKIVKK